MKTITATVIATTTAPVWKREYAGTRETLVYAGKHLEDAEKEASRKVAEYREESDTYDSDVVTNYAVRVDTWERGVIVDTYTRYA